MLQPHSMIVVVGTIVNFVVAIGSTKISSVRNCCQVDCIFILKRVLIDTTVDGWSQLNIALDRLDTRAHRQVVVIDLPSLDGIIFV